MIPLNTVYFLLPNHINLQQELTILETRPMQIPRGSRLDGAWAGQLAGSR